MLSLPPRSQGNIVMYQTLPKHHAIWSTGSGAPAGPAGCAPADCAYRLELTAEGALRAVAANGTLVWSPPGEGETQLGTELVLQVRSGTILVFSFVFVSAR